MNNQPIDLGGVQIPSISVVVVDSRSKSNPEWVETCLSTIKNQIFPNDLELVVVDNTEKTLTIGEAFNLGVSRSTGKYVLFVGDDDYLSCSYVLALAIGIEKNKRIYGNIVGVTSYSIYFDEEQELTSPVTRCPTGMWEREFLLANPFDNYLVNNVDTDYFERISVTGKVCITLPYEFGYFYRQHNNQVSGRTPLKISKDKPDTVEMGEEFNHGFYFLASNPHFLKPIVERFKKGTSDDVLFKQHFSTNFARNSNVIWCDWGDENALSVQDVHTKAKKILRIHRYEVYSNLVNYLNFEKWDTVIFVGENVKNYIEQKRGKIDNAVVIPNGVDLTKYTLSEKERNNKIAWAGYISRKKNVGLMLFLANSLPDYEFHIAGKFQENDIYDHMKNKRPDNVFLYDWQEDLNEFFKDKTYLLNTADHESQGMSIMEGMACGLKPLVRNWCGSELIYPQKYIYNSIEDLKKMLSGEYNPVEYRNYILQNFNFEDIYKRIKGVIDVY